MTLWERRIRSFRRNRTAMAGLVIVTLVALVALAAPLLAGYDPEARVDAESVEIFRLPPSADHRSAPPRTGSTCSRGSSTARGRRS